MEPDNYSYDESNSRTDVERGNYTKELMDHIDSLDPFERQMFTETLKEYNRGETELIELLQTAESVLSTKEHLLMGFHVMVYDHERDEAIEHLTEAIEKKRSDQTKLNRMKKDMDSEEEGETVYATVEELEKMSDAMKKRIQEKDEMLFIKILQIQSNQQLLNNKKELEPIEYELVEDAFSFIMVNPRSFAAFTGFATFFLQMISYAIIMYSLRTSEGMSGNNQNMFSVPAAVDNTLTFSQGISIFFLITVQDGLWGAAFIFLDGFDPNLKREGIMPRAWYCGNSLRFTEGICMTVVTFLLIVRSDNVVQLFKDFTAMMFLTSLDDAVFVLGQRGYLSKGVIKTAEKVSNITYFSKLEDEDEDEDPLLDLVDFMKDLVKGLVRLFLLLVILSTMYSLWAVYVVIPQKNGTFLKDRLYIQIGDTLSPQLSRMSGFYKKSTKMKDGRVTYEAERIFTGEAPFIVRYCKNSRKWVFTVEDSQNPSQECQAALIKSEEVDSEGSYDLYSNPPIWYGESKTLPERFVPMTADLNIRVVQDEMAHLPPFSHVYQNLTCEQLLLDEGFTGFPGSRSWSDKYEVLLDNQTGSMVEVYQRPVFYSKNNLFDDTENWDVIIYLGYRWALLSSNQMYERGTREVIVKSYADLVSFMKGFDGYWSNYEVAFFSDPVELDSPNDYAFPVLLNWYSATNKFTRISMGRGQTANELRESEATFICATCSNQRNAAEYNKCFYGECLPNGTCACSSGSTGPLCQIIPKNNGHCDSFFNKFEFDFDGGDCCVSTCTSTPKHNCGMDSTGSYFVGYDQCHESNRLLKQPIHESTLKNNLNYTVSMVPNGRTIAVGNPIERYVVVFDQDGSQWKQNRLTLASNEKLFGMKIKLSSSFNSVNTKENLAPLTIAISSQNQVHIYDWNVWNSSWSLPTTFTDTFPFLDIQIYDEGRLLLLPENSFLNILSRKQSVTTWSSSQKIMGDFQFVSMSETGKDLFLAIKNSSIYYIDHYHLRNNGLEKESRYEVVGEVLTIKASYDGNSFVSIVRDMKDVVATWIYIKEDNSTQTFTRQEVAIRGNSISENQPSVAISDDGLDIRIVHDEERTIQKFQWNGTQWLRVNTEQFPGSSFSISRDFSSLVVANPSESYEKVSVYMGLGSKCEDNESLVRISLNPLGLNIDELEWIIEKINEDFDRMILSKKFEHNITVALTEEICVPKDACIYLSFLNPISSDVNFGKAMVLVDGQPLLDNNVRQSESVHSMFVLGDERCKGFHESLHEAYKSMHMGL